MQQFFKFISQSPLGAQSFLWKSLLLAQSFLLWQSCVSGDEHLNTSRICGIAAALFAGSIIFARNFIFLPKSRNPMSSLESSSLMARIGYYLPEPSEAHYFAVWAFGDTYREIKHPIDAMTRWNNLHANLLELDGNSPISIDLPKMITTWKKEMANTTPI